MADTNQIIASIIQKKNAFILNGNEAMRKIMEQLLEQVRKELGNAAISGWNESRLKQLQTAIQQQVAESEARMQSVITGETKTLWDLGQESVYQPMNANGISTGFSLSPSVIETLESFTFHKIQGVMRDAFSKINTELTLGILGKQTPADVAAAIGRDLTSPGVFKDIATRAEVIAKTEMGRTFSIASDMRLKQAANYVDGLEKQWVHAGHPQRPRLSHLAQDGRHVPVDEPYGIEDVNGYKLMFPRDPNADISEVINCGCDSVPWLKEWGLAEDLGRMVYSFIAA